MARARVLAAAGLLAAALHLAWLDAGLAFRLASKAVPVLCLMLWVRARPQSAYSRAVSLGLLASLAGDELLELDGLFLAGLAAFLCAHLCYAYGFWSECRRPAWLRGLAFLVVLGGVYAALWPGLGPLRLPVAVYASAFGLALWRAAACLGQTARGRGPEWLALAGALLFATSDGLIGWTRFQAPVLGAAYAIMILYWVGQTLIALSVEPSSRAQTSGAGMAMAAHSSRAGP